MSKTAARFGPKHPKNVTSTDVSETTPDVSGPDFDGPQMGFQKEHKVGAMADGRARGRQPMRSTERR